MADGERFVFDGTEKLGYYRVGRQSSRATYGMRTRIHITREKLPICGKVPPEGTRYVGAGERVLVDMLECGECKRIYEEARI